MRSNKETLKKGQLSFFMIVGFIVVVIMGVMFYFNKQQIGTIIRVQAIESQELPLEVQTVKNYVTGCLDRTSRDAIYLLGMQGGKIYKSQGGFLTDPKEQDLGKKYVNMDDGNNNYTVFYGINRLPSNLTCQSSVFCQTTNIGSDRNNYPWADYRYNNPEPDQRNCYLTSSCFGRNNFPDIPLVEMYSQIKKYVESNIKNCINFSELSEFDVNGGEFTVDVDTYDETVVAIMRYPIEITTSNVKKSTKLEYFYFDTGVRLQLLYELSKEMIKKDINDENFDIKQGVTDYMDDNISINVSSRFTSGIKITPDRDNIVRILDTKPQRPFIFQFARENREPVLEYIPEQKNSLTSAELESSMKLAYDPDEDPVYIRYYEVSSPNEVLTTFNKPCNSKIGVCVSDYKYGEPQNICVSDVDFSRDWQEVEIVC